MAGVAFAVDGDGVGFATESYAASALYTTLASLSGALWRIRRANYIVFLLRAGRRNDGPIVADFAAHRSVAVVVAVFVRSDRDDCDVVDHRVPQMAQGNLRHRSCSKYRSARGCHLCLRYDLLPMSPGWTYVNW